jgi:iron complex transport system ATP-binding protein
VLEVLDGLAGAGTTVVAALHDLTLAAAHADNVVVMARGRVAAAGATSTTLTPKLVREVFGVEAKWVGNPLTGRPMLAVAKRR